MRDYNAPTMDPIPVTQTKQPSLTLVVGETSKIIREALLTMQNVTSLLLNEAADVGATREANCLMDEADMMRDNAKILLKVITRVNETIGG